MPELDLLDQMALAMLEAETALVQCRMHSALQSVQEYKIKQTNMNHKRAARSDQPNTPSDKSKDSG